MDNNKKGEDKKMKGGIDDMGKIVLEKPILHKWKCDRCGHIWIPRSEDMPHVCPKCMSPYWNTPRKLTENAKQ